ncbi:hypothetical protein QWZ13_16645 [Reinekea marina]|uniref:hypothetical protein n=1 Tax=Reinekea marina TaxID=1310421 RepID=UPI0025B5D60B|nr:hypothetical protein [Reinekea marina]MDN3650537.1 hypothetical protein [Reinekea marina]
MQRDISLATIVILLSRQNNGANFRTVNVRLTVDNGPYLSWSELSITSLRH